jgi:hypothetical protein
LGGEPEGFGKCRGACELFFSESDGRQAAAVVRFLTHSDLNSKFDINIIFIINYFLNRR